jgi:hypothetical protein
MQSHPEEHWRSNGGGSEQTGAIRELRVPASKRFAALSSLAKTLIEKRGQQSVRGSPQTDRDRNLLTPQVGEKLARHYSGLPWYLTESRR